MLLQTFQRWGRSTSLGLASLFFAGALACSTPEANRTQFVGISDTTTQSEASIDSLVAAPTSDIPLPFSSAPVHIPYVNLDIISEKDGTDSNDNYQTQEPPLLHCFKDDDGDGYGDKQKWVWLYEWVCPEGTVGNMEDCDDTDENNFPGNTEICDLDDDNCNGYIDEGFWEIGLGDPCSAGTGICYSEGLMVCTPDGQGVICNAQELPSENESCNGLDDDCNGLTDDGLPYFETECGEIDENGEFLAEGICQPGVIADYCDPNWGEFVTAECSAVFPSPELCDELDNDCNGETDEGFNVGETCYVGIGECVSQGVFACLPGGAGTYCDAQPKLPQPEICNGLDDDCDGDIDEYLDVAVQLAEMSPCETKCGDGEFICLDGQLTCDAPKPMDYELCNGLDDDCDGETDETYNSGEVCTLGIGECLDIGKMVCHENQLSTYCNATPNPPGLEICDGLDNDCDSQIDELEDLQPQLDVLGDCFTLCSEGEYICFDGEIVCNAQGYSTEICDYMDNDCDALVDEDFEKLGDPCTVGQGACLAEGTFVCTADGSGVGCSAVGGMPEQEICYDKIDNDCNGEADEGCCDQTKPIQDIVPCNSLLLYFKIDDTSSMYGAIDEASQLSEDISTIIFASLTNVYFGLGTFKDTDQNEYGILPYDIWKGTVKSLTATGGGDTPEASLNSLDHMLSVEWTAELALEEWQELSIYVIHMTDAPWHKDGDGTKFSEGLTIAEVAWGYVSQGLNYIGIQFPYEDGKDMLEFASYFPEGGQPAAMVYIYADFPFTLAGIVAGAILENEPLQSWTECTPEGKLVKKTSTCGG